MFSLMISLALAAAAPEATTSQPTAETAAAPEKAKPKLICRRIADTGSRFSERECRTQEDWNKQADSISKRMGATSKN